MQLTSFKTYSLAGLWSVEGTGQGVMTMRVPGTLDEYNIGVSEGSLGGEEDDETSYTPSRCLHRYTFTGPVRISRQVTFRETQGRRYFIEAERARELKLLIDGEEIPLFEERTLPVPAVFEVTGRIDGTHTVTFVSDNRYRVWPREEILQSNAANPDTTVNWNGLPGAVRIREENLSFISFAEVKAHGGTADIYLELTSEDESVGLLRVQSDAFLEAYEQEIVMLDNRAAVHYDAVPLIPDIRRWSPDDPFLYELRLWYEGDEKVLSFGIRDFTYDSEGHFLLNGQRMLLRGETNEAVFPETVYPPSDLASWEKLYKTYQAYGVNFVYFRGYCPPDAAFEAADRAGLLVMPELSLMHPVSQVSYYRDECMQILREFSHHPSFAALSFGLSVEDLLSGTAFEPSEALEEIFSTAVSEYPEYCYIAGGEMLQEEKDDRKPPVLRFFTGGYEMLPDFREIDLYSGRLMPENLQAMQDAASRARLIPKWEHFAEESGENALRCYRNTIQKLRTGEPHTDGIILSGLQDMSGFGTHPHGMLNAHGVRKRFSFADPERFRSFFGDVLLAVMPNDLSLEYESTLKGRAILRNDGTSPVTGTFKMRLAGNGYTTDLTGPEVTVLPGKQAVLAELYIPLSRELFREFTPCELKLTASFGKFTDRKSVFLYPPVIPVCPESVYETDTLDEDALEFLENGGNVFLTPRVSARPVSIPLFRLASDAYFAEGLPVSGGQTEAWDRLLQGVPFALPRPIRPIAFGFRLQHLDIPDCYLAEVRCGSGAVLLSGLGLKEKMQYPETRALVDAIYRYLDSYDFSPRDELMPADLARIAEGLKEEQDGFR